MSTRGIPRSYCNKDGKIEVYFAEKKNFDRWANSVLVNMILIHFLKLLNWRINEMPKPSILIDKQELKDELEKLPRDLKISELCKQLSQTDWAKKQKNSIGEQCGASSSVLYSRLTEFGLYSKPKTDLDEPQQQKIKRKKVSSPTKLQTKQFLSDIPSKYKKLAQKALNGSLVAAVRLKCLDCVCYQASLIGDDGCSTCPLSAYIYKKRGIPSTLE